MPPAERLRKLSKHPATFGCTICPKRFTRAFNLRSHLMTHTDERPFGCTLCGKAFARHTDRKTHESLHTGERKFVCKGDLASGQKWGCGRRFALKKNLQRHFRSDKGRECIQPLLDQESPQRRSVLLAASALTGLGNSLSASEQARQQPPEQNRPQHDSQLSIDLPTTSFLFNQGEQMSRPEPYPPQLSASAPPTRDEALKAANIVRQYISRYGQLNTVENGFHGYLELTFKSVFASGIFMFET